MFRKLTAMAAAVCSLNAVGAKDAYKFAGGLTLEDIANLRGGIASGNCGLANLDLTLTIDTQAAGWWDNGSWFIYALGDYGRDPAKLTGDSQTISNIATENTAKIFEFWYKHHFANDTVQLLVGLHNYNSAFYALDSASLFSAASFGIGTDTAQVGPSIFATTAMATQLKYQQGSYYAEVAAYDGIPGDPHNPHGTHIQFNKGDGVFTAVESGFQQDKSYKIALGAWHTNAHVENPIDGNSSHFNQGAYLIGEYYFTDNWVAFTQIGSADSRYNAVDHFWGGGLRHNNFLADGDAIGLGFGLAQNGDPYLEVNPGLESAETIYELVYARPLMLHLSMKSSLYYIQNPGMSPDLANALALGMRLYISF